MTRPTEITFRDLAPDAVSPALAIDRLERQAAKTQAALQTAIAALEKALAELPQLLAGTPAAAQS